MRPEDSYGRRKRFEFVAQTIHEIAPSRVLDMGCGTGLHLTRPLGETFPDIRILGVDSDEASLRHARLEPCPANVEFASSDSLSAEDRFDLVISCEVLEHVENPPAFMNRLSDLIHPDGRMVLTVPNGYGPFEAFSLLEVVLNLTGLQKLLRTVKRCLVRSQPSPCGAGADTLAVSPHVNFFSMRELKRLIEASGCKVLRYQPATFLCGYGIDSLLRGTAVITWNARIAERLPAWCASDWMFELAPGGVKRPIDWRPGAWARFRRRLNQRRWGLC